MSAPLISQAYYLEGALNDPEGVLERARVLLADVDYDTLIGTGLSGALVLPLLARGLKKHFAVVRKPDNSHSGNSVEGAIGARWVFVDDLICSGSTLKRTFRAVEDLASRRCHSTKLAGAFLYHESRFSEAYSLQCYLD